TASTEELNSTISEFRKIIIDLKETSKIAEELSLRFKINNEFKH
ncbi:methyl-accepting chemotaxis sensory transducer, partial [Methanocaldococcus villosus KIN24-T80]